MKRKIKISLTVGIILIVAVFLYFYFPSIISDTIYPLKYKDLVKKRAEEFALDPNFVCAVIFSESRFNADSTSPVGAVGLMQIMPQTGRGIAQKFGEEKSFSAAKLYEPETNLKYGAWYLRFLQDKYKDDLELVLIAYNGGVPLADRYSAQRGSLNTETYYYVGKVQNAKKIYDQMYGTWWQEKEKPKKPTLSDLIISWLLGVG